MRIRLLALLMGMMLGLTSSALAQNPEEGEVGDMDMGGDDMGGELSGDDMGGELSGDDEVAEPAGDSGAAKPVSVGLLLGYGISLEDGANPWGLGFGLRGGYNLDAIYLGARFVYYLGASEDISTGFGTIETSVNIWELGIEGGYDVDAGGLVVRPAFGLGLASINVEAGGASGSESEFYIAPAVSGLADVADDIFIGAEARFMLILADSTAKAITLLATGGMRF